ncbi:hypothetical protein NEMBOFW57_002778 [Staphylotrichum longicolle]|uniref:Ribosome biogenesis protein SLX9 n=1 Tax=Staphylotrichum longicolle TaxID=669026 RepID=A0AAD4F3I4_9PEZI|nr:hypothetical protein NEMBOFW57_002778 [Staphylotrichum longicolle]
MAPTAPAPSKRPTARQKARARLADPLLPRKLHRADNVVSDGFIDSKADKRLIKHSAFLSRVAKSSKKSASGSSQTKRRRPNKKLVATLESLGDALDDIQAEIDEEVATGEAMDAEQARQGKVRHKSLKTRPGALKRKERLVKGEMERFGRSLAQLANVSAAGAAATGARAATAVGQDKMETQAGAQTQTQTQAAVQPSGTSNRWAALRGFISATMEQNPAFWGKT